jgi:hypothetical protein
VGWLLLLWAMMVASPAVADEPPVLGPPGAAVAGAISPEEAWVHVYQRARAVTAVGIALPAAGVAVAGGGLLMIQGQRCEFCVLIPFSIGAMVAAPGVPIAAFGGLRECKALNMLGEHRHCLGAKLALASVPTTLLAAVIASSTGSPGLTVVALAVPLGGYLASIVQFATNEYVFQHPVDVALVPTFGRGGRVGVALAASF